MPSLGREHEVFVDVEGREVFDWSEYQIDSSMIEPADSFSLTRPFDSDAWDACFTDARVRVMIDGVPVVDGFIDERRKDARANTIQIVGRDRAGRLVQEASPRVVYGGLPMTEVIRRLVDPWFTTVTLSNARNRNVRRGRGGHRVASGTEPVVLDQRSSVRIDPGQVRWSVIEEIVSAAGLLAWSSADGKEFIVGKPNHQQAPQYVVRHVRPGSTERSTCVEMLITESIADRFSIISVVGSGGGTDSDYGSNVVGRRARVLDGPNPDGTGLAFVRPKRLIMPERSLRSNREAKAIAERERARRAFRSNVVEATMPFHGQLAGGTMRTLFAPDTVARVVDEEIGLDDTYLIYACEYTGDGNGGEKTRLSMVPTGTEIVL